jgi:tRNA1Val (adenine37-N6)-methyltransferase
MSNTFFHFKHFSIHQDRCAMKVSTDACIQGAWTPIDAGVIDALDIGAGTGLLSLMLAQRNNILNIDAIELDAGAAQQAMENFSASLWNDRLNVIHTDARYHQFSKQYDMVICNPPFFSNSLLGDNEKRNAVRHNLSLSFDDLWSIINKVLKPEGYASVLLPVTEHEIWAGVLNKQGWHIKTRLEITPKAGRQYNRVVSVCSRQQAPTWTETIQIYDTSSGYTKAFTDLLRPFYQKL